MAQLTKEKSWARKQHSYAYIYKIYLIWCIKTHISQKLLDKAISYHLTIVTMPKDSDFAF